MRISRLEMLGKDRLQQIVDESSSIKEVMKKCGLSVKGTGNYQTAKDVFCKLGINISELMTRSAIVKTRKSIKSRTRSLESILVENSNYNRFHLKKRLIKAGIIEDKCQKCGLDPIWCGEYLSLQLDHINGKSTDNRKENLRLLCPNCHSQTTNYSGKVHKVSSIM